MNPGDKAICQEIAREIIKEVLVEHVQSCPHGRSLLRYTCISLGIAVGSGLASGGIVLTVFKLLLT
jgi:hypothetical protein